MRAASLIFVFVLAACSVGQVRVETPLLASSEGGAVFHLPHSVSVEASNVRDVELRRNTRWRLLGSIDRGRVYEPLDQVVTVNGFNVHEAYIVVRNDQVVGYYLPYEETFVESETVAIKLVKN